MSDWPATDGPNDPIVPRLSLEEELPIDDGDDIADQAVIDRDEDEQSSRPADLPSEKLMD
jgi:hypothetical protein